MRTAVIFAVRTLTGEEWGVGKFAPIKDEPESLRIETMYQDEDRWIQVFCTPIKNPEAFQGGRVIIDIAPNVIRDVHRAAMEETWQALQREMSDAEVAKFASQWTGLPEDLLFEHIAEARTELDEGEGEEEEIAQIPDAPAPALPAAAPNGSPS